MSAPLFDHLEEALDALHKTVLTSIDENRSLCIIVPSKHNTFAVRQSLESINISTTILGPDERDKPDSKSIRIATMHRAKGLDFDEVVLLIPKNEKNFDLSIDTNKRLKYVALTRAKRIASVIQY